MMPGREMEINMTAKTAKISGKVSDMCQVRLYDDSGQLLKDYDGYALSFISSICNGCDYLSFTIDLEAGHILNWKKPNEKDVKAFINGEDW